MASDSCDGVSWGETSFQSNCDASLRVADSSQWSLDQVRKVLKETQDALTQRKQHIYHYLYVDDRIFFSSERGLPVVQVCHLCEKAIAPFAWNVQPPVIFVTASNYHWLSLLGVSSKNCGDRHFTAQYGSLFTLNDPRPALEEI